MSSVGATRWPGHLLRKVVGTHERAWVPHGGMDSCCGRWSAHMSSVGATRWHGQLLRKVVGTHEQRGCHTVAWTPVAEGGRHT